MAAVFVSEIWWHDI